MNNPPIPDSFRKLPLPMPPTLPEVMGITSDKRFFRLNYEGSKAFWSDGRAGATFSYYAAYNPYVNHVAMSIHLLGCNLGHDDESPTHSLLVDRQETTVYVGAYNEVRRFLQAQHPPRRPPTPEEIEEMNRYLAGMERLSFDALRGRGMFEFLLGPKPEQQDRCAEMVAWLDQFITDDLIQAYVGAAEAGQVEAFYYLDTFRRRVERAREVNTSSDWTN
jgi:hypothetical protein